MGGRGQKLASSACICFSAVRLVVGVVSVFQVEENRLKKAVLKINVICDSVLQ